MNDGTIPQYPWSEGDTVFASALNAAIAFQANPLVAIGDAAPAGAPDRMLWWDSSGSGLYIRYNDGNSTQWVTTNNQNTLADAPHDGNIYGRANAAWIPLTSSGAAYLPLTGGTVTGKTTITLDTSSLPANAGATTFETVLNTSGPTSGFSISTQTRLTVNGGTTSANKYNNPAILFWSSAIKYLPAGGLPAGTTQLQDQWAYIGNNIDATNGPSSIGGVLISEFDTTANHRDDGAQRSGAVYVFGLSWPVGPPPAPRPSYGPPPLTGGWPAAFNSGLSFAIEANCVVNVGVAMGLQYSTALWDSRGAILHGGTIQTTVAAGGTTLHVNNVVGYMQWGGSTTPVSVSNPMPVIIGANTYSVTGAAFDAPSSGVTTTLGTLTLSSGIIGTDGAAGTAVVQRARTIWLGNGQQLCLAGTGNAYLMADTSDGIQVYTPTGVTINAGLGVAGNAQIGNALSVLGSASAATIQTGGTSGPTWTTGSVAPAATAPVGSLYSRVGGAVGATLYVSRGGGTWAAVAGV